MRFHCLFSLRIPRDVAGLRHRGKLNVFHWILACQASRNGITTLCAAGGERGRGGFRLNRIALHGMAAGQSQSVRHRHYLKFMNDSLSTGTRPSATPTSFWHYVLAGSSALFQRILSGK